MTSSSPAVANMSFRTIDLRGRHLSAAGLKQAMPRAVTTTEVASDAVAAIIADVRTRGYDALTELAERFDHVQQHRPLVPRAALTEALDQLDPKIRVALEESIRRARLFAEAQHPQDTELQIGPGATVTQKWVAVNRVGLYVPGGLAVYPSSVIMNVVPAQAAGVTSLALASPPQRLFGGLPHPTILAAAELLGIEEVYAMGGAQAIAAFAYGVPAAGANPELEPVDVVTGPGNVYVATAKRLVKGVVGIDAEAGPTEIAILADESADARLVAADLISQAEHDPNAASVLVTDSTDLAERVRGELSRQVPATRHRERVATALSGPQSGTVLVENLEQGIAVCNAYGAEHLEVQTVNAEEVAARITSAGAIFVGSYSPVSLGDYCSGSNHVLPTAGTAAFSSGLNVTTFMHAIQVINYDRAALQEVSGHVVALSHAEDLPAHGDAVSVRFSS
ncbi:histidinol dehydrogenase [Arthrobacter sp. UYP6]